MWWHLREESALWGNAHFMEEETPELCLHGGEVGQQEKVARITCAKAL